MLLKDCMLFYFPPIHITDNHQDKVAKVSNIAGSVYHLAAALHRLEQNSNAWYFRLVLIHSSFLIINFVQLVIKTVSTMGLCSFLKKSGLCKLQFASEWHTTEFKHILRHNFSPLCSFSNSV